MEPFGARHKNTLACAMCRYARYMPGLIGFRYDCEHPKAWKYNVICPEDVI